MIVKNISVASGKATLNSFFPPPESPSQPYALKTVQGAGEF
jgi:hypothetical protein